MVSKKKYNKKVIFKKISRKNRKGGRDKSRKYEPELKIKEEIEFNNVGDIEENQFNPNVLNEAFIEDNFDDQNFNDDDLNGNVLEDENYGNDVNEYLKAEEDAAILTDDEEDNNMGGSKRKSKKRHYKTKKSKKRHYKTKKSKKR